jgi:hypothetical protein
MLLLTENIKKVSQSQSKQCTSTAHLCNTNAEENRETSSKKGNADDIRDMKCLQTDGGSNFLIGEEGEKIQ